MSSLSDEHAIVTGAGRGIGEAIARLLASRGCAISLMGRNHEILEKTAADLRVTYGIRTSVIPLDVTKEDEVIAGFKEAIGALGTPFILVNNAGAAESAPIHSMDAKTWDTMLAVNLTGVFYCTREAVQSMRKAKRGRIINISSTAGIRGYQYVSAYCAAKHGVVGMTRALAIELQPSGITVNAVCPGFVDTDLFQRSIDEVVKKTNRPRDEIVREFLKDAPGGRLVQPQEVAEKVVWFCEKDQGAVSGESLLIEGVIK